MGEHQKRKSIRFLPEENTTAWVNGAAALVFSEAHRGCGLIMVAAHCPVKGEEVTLVIGPLAPLRGIVRWRKNLDAEVAKIGIEYLD